MPTDEEIAYLTRQQLVWPTIDEALLSVGVEPNTTPVDHLTEAAQWALANQRFQWETDTDDYLSSDDRT